MDRHEQMIEALRDGLHGLHLARMALVGEAKALRIAGRKAERDRVWARVEEITAQIETTNRELAEHMLFPCPFCGGVAKPTFGMDEHWCFCTVCGAAGPFHGTRQESVDAWNTRTAWRPDDRRSGE
jgi:Lar family restriction alleviation protein